jgi:lysozyme family protein
MTDISLTPNLRSHYENLFNTCTIRPDKAGSVENIIKNIIDNQNRYRSLEATLGVPWGFIAVVHSLESSLSFTGHLHNGDPLINFTIQIPKGRPKGYGNPPFTWEQSAADALKLKGLSGKTGWSLASTLYQLERYNGWGHRKYHPHILSPYLWSFSSHYVRGKYVADGTWSETAISKQCGAAVLLRRMAEIGHIYFSDQPPPDIANGPVIVRYSAVLPSDPKAVAAAKELQQWLNTFSGIFVKVDGIPGQRTSDAYMRITGRYLSGDPRQN